MNNNALVNFCYHIPTTLIQLSLALFLIFSSSPVYSETPNTYVGSDVCKDCHETEYQNFFKFSKMSRSFQNVKKLRKGLTPEEFEKCLGCHTTGYGKPGGFYSEEKTPVLQNNGCESCHGPGDIHVKTEEQSDIQWELTEEDCNICHIEQKVQSFHLKPMIHGGVH
ncbi:cytochrome c family protein [Deltaproteobacteria bacterium TL4]